MSAPASKPKVPPPPSKIHKKIISLKFSKGFDWNNIEIIELKSFEDFFNFYQENHDKGCIYDVKLK